MVLIYGPRISVKENISMLLSNWAYILCNKPFYNFDILVSIE